MKPIWYKKPLKCDNIQKKPNPCNLAKIKEMWDNNGNSVSWPTARYFGTNDIDKWTACGYGLWLRLVAQTRTVIYSCIRTVISTSYSSLVRLPVHTVHRCYRKWIPYIVLNETIITDMTTIQDAHLITFMNEWLQHNSFTVECNETDMTVIDIDKGMTILNEYGPTDITDVFTVPAR